MKIDQAVDEQRRNRRLFMELKIGVAVISRFPALFFWRPQFEATTQDVSARGLALLTDRPLPAQAVVKLWIQLPSGLKIKLHGTVVRTGQGAAPGSYLCHINLRDQPEEAVRIWEATLFGNMRNYEV